MFFAFATELLIGVSYAAVAMFIYNFGNLIKNSLNETEDNPLESTDIKQYAIKVQILTVSISVLFLIKSLLSLATGLGLFGDVFPKRVNPNVWDFVVFLITEILPTVIFIGVVKKLSSEEENKQNLLNEEETTEF